MIDGLEHILNDLLENGTGRESQNKTQTPHSEEWAMDIADKLLAAQSIGSMAAHGVTAPGLASLLLKLDSEYFNDSQKESWEEYIAHNLLETLF